MGVEYSSNFRAYRGTTSSANQEILDFSALGGGKFKVQRLIFAPDTDCDIILNNRGFSDKIEGGLETKSEDMDIYSLKVVQSGISFYVQCFVA